MVAQFIYNEVSTPDSSVIRNLYYNKNSKELAVSFHNGSAVKYGNFDESTWSRMKNALSIGSYYNTYVKGNMRFPTQHLGNQPVFSQDMMDAFGETQKVETAADVPNVSVTVNIYVNGNPEDIARAVEKLAPSFRHITRKV